MMFSLLGFSAPTFSLFNLGGFKFNMNVGHDPMLGEKINQLQSNFGTLQNSITEQTNTLSNIQTAIHSGFEQQAGMLSTIQSSIGALGLVSVLGCALSAVNVYQLVRVRKDLNNLEKKLESGFEGMQFFISRGFNDLSSNLEIKQLSLAYSQYRKGLEQMNTALLIENPANRNNSLALCINIFTNALAKYEEQYESSTINIPAKLRCLECCWVIQNSIAEAYQRQEEYAASLHTYKKLHQQILQHTEKFKQSMTVDNHHFITGDFNIIHENDVKIINVKTELLDSIVAKKVFQPAELPITNIDKENQSQFLEKLSFQGTQELMDCFISPAKITHFKDYLEKHQLSSSQNILEMYFNYYSDVGMQWFEDDISNIVNKIISGMKPFLIGVRGLYFHSIPSDKLEGAKRGYALAAGFDSQKEVPLSLLDTTLFGNATAGFLLTNRKIYSDLYNIFWENIINAKITNSTLFINGRWFCCDTGLSHNALLAIQEIFVYFIEKMTNIYKQRGFACLKLEKPKEAIEWFNKVIERNQEDIETIEQLVFLNAETTTLFSRYREYLLNSKNIDKLIRLVQFRPQDRVTKSDYFNLLKRENDLVHLEQFILTLCPDDIEFSQSYMQHLIATNSMDKFENLVRSKPNNELIIRSYLDYLINQKDLLRFSNLLKIKPNYLPTKAGYAFLLKDLNQFEESLNYFNEVIEAMPEHALGHFSLVQDKTLENAYEQRGIILSKLKRHEESLKDFEKVLSFNPNNYDVSWKKIFTLMYLKRHEEVEVFLNTFSKENNTPREIQLAHFCLLLKMGQMEKAVVMKESLFATEHDYFKRFLSVLRSSSR
jgi:tetratricopeptide (TPR) repeat protein